MLEQMPALLLVFDGCSCHSPPPLRAVVVAGIMTGALCYQCPSGLIQSFERDLDNLPPAAIIPKGEPYRALSKESHIVNLTVEFYPISGLRHIDLL